MNLFTVNNNLDNTLIVNVVSQEHNMNLFTVNNNLVNTLIVNVVKII